MSENIVLKIHVFGMTVIIHVLKKIEKMVQQNILDTFLDLQNFVS